jgi:beta-galactosidase
MCSTSAGTRRKRSREIDSDWWREALQAPATPASVALVFDYEAAWMHQIQPQGRSFSYLALVFNWYTALRRLGLDIDIVPAGGDLRAYRAVFVPSLPHVSAAAVQALASFDGVAVFGIRTGAKTESFQIPREQPPGPLQALLPMKVARVRFAAARRDVVWETNLCVRVGARPSSPARD